MVMLGNIRTDFDDIWHKYSKGTRIGFACFSFHVGLHFINFSSLKPDTEDNANFDAVSLSSKCANVNELEFA